MATTNKLSTLWIGDLEPYMDETFLKHSFTLMGENLLTAKVIRNRFTGGMMGYGFLDFGDESTSLRVLHRCNGKVIPNASPPKRFKLNHATYGKEVPGIREWSLFVGDLSEDVDDLALFVAFSTRYPSVKAAKVVLDQNGVSKGYGFVRFFSESEYNSSLIEVQNTVFVGNKPVRVSIATPKSRLTTTTTTLPETVTNTVISSVTSGGSATSAAAVQQTAQQYYQQYGYDYSSYYQAYYQQQQQQQQQQYYGYSYDPSTYYDYSQQMQTYYDTSNYEVPEIPVAETKIVQDNVLEEHDAPLDIEQLNADAMARNEDAYVALDTSRWLPVDGLNPPMVTVKY